MQTSFMIETRVSNSLKEIDRSDWEKLFPGQVKGYDFFKTVESTLAGQFKFYYLIFYNDAEIFGIVPCFLMDYPLDTTLEGPLKKIALWMRKQIPGFFGRRRPPPASPASKGLPQSPELPFGRA